MRVAPHPTVIYRRGSSALVVGEAGRRLGGVAVPPEQLDRPGPEAEAKAVPEAGAVPEAEAEGGEATSARRGRRRDPSIDRRVADAVIEVYARAGWNGLTMDEVARQARVGKAALYLRWSSKEELLVDAMASAAVPVAPETSGNIRTDLLELARALFELYSTTAGSAYLRLYVEARYIPSLEQTWRDRASVPRLLESRALVRRAIASGELAEGTSPTILLDALAGAIGNHVLSTPADLYEEMIAQAPAYLEGIVDFVLAGAEALAARRPASRGPASGGPVNGGGRETGR